MDQLNKSNALCKMGEFIRANRLKQTPQVSQKDVGIACSVAESFISMVETGIKPLPDRYLVNVAKIIAVPVDKLKELKMNYYKEVMEREIDSSNRKSA